MSKFTFSAESPAKQKRSRAEISRAEIVQRRNELYAEIAGRTDEGIHDSEQRSGADKVRLIF
jgi:hypothetical protein